MPTIVNQYTMEELCKGTKEKSINILTSNGELLFTIQDHSDGSTVFQVLYPHEKPIEQRGSSFKVFPKESA